jgi:hypothetical protein
LTRIFLSYHRANEAAAERVVRVLTEQASDRGDAITVWTDKMLPGGSYSPIELEKRLAESNFVIVLWSLDASRSPWIVEEASYALEDGKLIVGTLDKTPIPPLFQRIQLVDLRGWGEQESAPGTTALKRVIERLKGARVQHVQRRVSVLGIFGAANRLLNPSLAAPT